MTTKRIIYADLSGDVKVVCPSEDFRLPGELDGSFLARVQAKDVPAGSTNVTVIDMSSLPDRRFRSAWECLSGGLVRTNIPALRQLIAGRIRDQRDSLLADSDGDKVRLDDIGTSGDRSLLFAYRQQLRAFPAQVVQETSGFTRAMLEAYTPTFPVKPNV